MKRKYFFFTRAATKEGPAGTTVSKHPTLPAGDFTITSYIWTEWGYQVLWFVDQDRFTAKERNEIFRGNYA